MMIQIRVLASLTLCAVLLFAGGLASRSARADPDVDINIFFNALAPYGTWVDHQAYGRVWFPSGVSRDWRPYTDGHWEYTREYGWLWVSDWEWGWAPFHYGRWVFDDWYGWLWIPGRIWAPAWVLWRYGGGYVAWAPLPPELAWRPRYGLAYDHFDYDRDIDRDCWVAVRDRHFHDRHVRNYVVRPQYNINVLNVTKNISYITASNDRIVNRGIPVERIERASGRTVPVVPLRETEGMDTGSVRRDRRHIDIVRPAFKPVDAEEERRQQELAERAAQERRLRREAEGPQARRERDEPRIPKRLQQEQLGPIDATRSPPTVPDRFQQPLETQRRGQGPGRPQDSTPQGGRRPSPGTEPAPAMPQAPAEPTRDWRRQDERLREQGVRRQMEPQPLPDSRREAEQRAIEQQQMEERGRRQQEQMFRQQQETERQQMQQRQWEQDVQRQQQIQRQRDIEQRALEQQRREFENRARQSPQDAFRQQQEMQRRQEMSRQQEFQRQQQQEIQRQRQMEQRAVERQRQDFENRARQSQQDAFRQQQEMQRRQEFQRQSQPRPAEPMPRQDWPQDRGERRWGPQ